MKNELRIGNLVSFENADFNICKVCSIYITHFNAVNISTYIDYGDSLRTNYKPIPLTEEWLVKLGAKTSGNNQIVYDRFLLTWKPEYKYWYVVCVNTLAYMTKIEYVHEWQNFVYVMNNQELTIKHN